MSKHEGSRPRRPGTTLVTGGRDRAKSFDFVNPPLVRGSTVLHDSVAHMKARVQARQAGQDEVVSYGIYGTPTHHAFYEALNALEGGYRSWALPSGLAACTMALLAFVRAGDHVLIPDSVYWPTRRFALQTLSRFGIETTLYDPCLGEELEQLFRPTTRVLFMESPGSLTFEMQDVPLLASMARRRGAFSVIDNTWATPLYFQPLAHGVDVSLHAATKYIGGHSDLLMGTLTVNERAWPAIREAMHFYGLTTSPDDVYVAHRGLHSLRARLALHRANAERLIAWLREQPEVERILYPALPDDPGHALWKRDMSGASGLFGVVLKPALPAGALEALIDASELFGRGVSWGGYESLMIPATPERTVTRCAFEGRLFRISAGLEDADDLVADLERSFAALRALR
ncbi:MAG: cystathionine beta-lyase [Betaproteobacteria bacterium]